MSEIQSNSDSVQSHVVKHLEVVSASGGAGLLLGKRICWTGKYVISPAWLRFSGPE